MASIYVKLWEIWPGRNVILFDGNCLTGPDVALLFGTLGMVGIPLRTFLGTMRRLCHNSIRG